jgi:hypothetical protein
MGREASSPSKDSGRAAGELRFVGPREMLLEHRAGNFTRLPFSWASPSALLRFLVNFGPTKSNGEYEPLWRMDQ